MDTPKKYYVVDGWGGGLKEIRDDRGLTDYPRPENSFEYRDGRGDWVRGHVVNGHLVFNDND